MKFGDHLTSNLFPPWRSEYIQYNMLKQQLKARQLDHTWNSQDETWFSQSVTSELTKVDLFLSRKRYELQSRINYCEQTLQIIAHNSPAPSSLSASLSAPLQQGVVTAIINDNDDNEQWISSLQQALIEILYDTTDLSKFVRLNYTGFQKILKKHDKWTHLHLQSQMTPLFQQRGLDNQRFDDLLVKISQLRDLCRLCSNKRISAELEEVRNSVVEDDNTSDAGDFERATEKYWVHPENVTEVKALLLFHLPILRYNSDRPYEESETAISSVYMDNQQLDLYTERLQRDEGAEAIRLRW